MTKIKPPASWSEVKLIIETSGGKAKEVPLHLGEKIVVDLGKDVESIALGKDVKSIDISETFYTKDPRANVVLQSDKKQIVFFTKDSEKKMLGVQSRLSSDNRAIIEGVSPKDAPHNVATFKLLSGSGPGNEHKIQFEFFEAQNGEEPTLAYLPEETLTGVTKEMKTVQMPASSEETLTVFTQEMKTVEMNTAQWNTWVTEHLKQTREDIIHIGPAELNTAAFEDTMYVPPLTRKSLPTLGEGFSGNIASSKRPHLEFVREVDTIPGTTLRKVSGLPRMTFGRFGTTAGAYMLLGLAGFGIKETYEYIVGRKAKSWEKLTAYTSPVAATIGAVLVKRGKAAIRPAGVSFVSGLVGFMPIGIGVSVSEPILDIDPDSLGGELGGLGVASALAAAASYAEVGGTSAAAAGLTATGVGASLISGVAVGASALGGVAVGHYVIDPGIGSLINDDGDGTASGFIAEQVYRDPWTLAIAVWPGCVPVGPAVYGAHRLYEWLRNSEIQENISPMNTNFH